MESQKYKRWTAGAVMALIIIIILAVAVVGYRSQQINPVAGPVDKNNVAGEVDAQKADQAAGQNAQKAGQEAQSSEQNKAGQNAQKASGGQSAMSNNAQGQASTGQAQTDHNQTEQKAEAQVQKPSLLAGGNATGSDKKMPQSGPDDVILSFAILAIVAYLVVLNLNLKQQRR